MNFGRVKIVTGVGTKGHGTEGSWTESYKLKYSLDGRAWFDYKKLYDDEEQVRELLLSIILYYCFY